MRKNFLLMMFAILLLGGCKKDKEVRIYTITEKTPTVDVAVASVSIRGYYYGYPSDLKSVTVAYTQNSDYSSASTILAENHNVYGADDYYYARLINLEPGTTYYYYCIFDTGYGSAEGKQWSFTTKSVSATAVTTSSVSNITHTTATCGGNVTSDGGATVTARGVCWGTSPNPTVSGSHTTDGSGTGSFTSNITGLTASTTYYVRAYATNSKGTGYGEQKSFTTQSGGGTSGCFSVSSTTTVEFAPGNLYWDGSAFRFEANQWSFADTWNASHVSHFKWSDAANAVTGDQTYSGDLFCDSNFTVTGDSHTWRTLSKDEWVYLINTRTGNRFAKARVSGVQGLLIFPDNYSGTTSGNGIAAVNTTNAAFPTSDIPSATWTSMESAGVVFLPAAGYRLGTSLDVVGSYGLYWSSTCSNSNDAYYMYFKSGSVYLQDYDPRYYGYSVRLVYGSQSVSVPTVTTASVSNITQTTATCGGNVTSDGGAAVTARGVCWSTSQNPTVFDSHTADGSGTGSFTSSITGLTANTTYYVRAYATNSAGTSYGEQESFTTLQSISVPTVTTSQVSNITHTTATCGGEVTSDGGSTVTARGVCWSTSQNPTVSDSHTTDGSGTGSFTSSITGLTANTTYYVRAYATNSAGTSYGEQKSFTTHDAIAGHEYVDLGLPSGLLWATCNVGAEHPYDWGDYYQWGGVTPVTSASINVGWANCPGNGGSSSFDAAAFSTWIAANLTGGVLNPDVDAATANWGGGWRMPTKEEWQELYDNTTSTWTTEDGVYGYKFTSKTDSSKYIFLPAAGFRYGTMLYNNFHGNYWSSSLYDNPDSAYDMFFNSDDVYPQKNTLRHSGFTVRPVR